MVKTQDPKKYLLTLLFSFLGLSGLTYFNYFMTGTLKVDDNPIILFNEITGRSLSFLFFCSSIWAYWKLLKDNFSKISLKSLLFWALAIHTISALALPYTSNDIFSNLAYGRLLFLGMDPFQNGPISLGVGDPFRSMVTLGWLNMPMVYGPIIGGLNLLSIFTNNVFISLLINKFLFLIFSLSIIFIAFKICVRFIPPGQRTSDFAFFAFNPLFIWEISAQAHNDGAMIFFTMIFLYFIFSNFLWPAYLSLLLGFFSKFAIFPLIGLFLKFNFIKNKRRAVIMGFLFLLSAFLYYQSFHNKDASILLIPFKENISPYRLTNSWFYFFFWALSPFGHSAQIWGIRIYGTLAYFFLFALGVRYAFLVKSTKDILYYSCRFLIYFSLLGMAGFQPWYITWLLPLTFTLKDKELKLFVATYSIIFLITYPITHRALGWVLNAGMLWFFVKVRNFSSVETSLNPEPQKG